MGRGDTADSWGLLSTVSSEPSFEVKMDVFLIEILRAGGWLPQPNTYSMQGKWYAQGPKLLSANPGICLCILCWGMWSFLRSHWGRQRRELQQKICASAWNLYWKVGRCPVLSPEEYLLFLYNEDPQTFLQNLSLCSTQVQVQRNCSRTWAKRSFWAYADMCREDLHSPNHYYNTGWQWVKTCLNLTLFCNS